MRIAFQGETGAFGEAAAERVDARGAAHRVSRHSTASSKPSSAVLRHTASADRELDRRHDSPDLRSAARARALDRRGGGGSRRAPSPRSARIDDRGAPAHLLAPAGARAVRALPADADRRRDRGGRQHGELREAGCRGGAARHRGHCVGACRRRLRPRRAGLGHSGFQRERDALHRRWTTRARRSDRGQNDGGLFAAGRARKPLQGARCVRAAKRRSHEARIAAGSRSSRGSTCSTPSSRPRATSCPVPAPSSISRSWRPPCACWDPTDHGVTLPKISPRAQSARRALVSSAHSVLSAVNVCE